MRDSLALILCSALAASASAAETGGRPELLRQLQATDLLAQSIERQPPATQASSSVVPYDQLFRRVMSQQSAQMPADLAGLSDYELRSALASVHQSNLAAYVDLGGLSAAAVDPIISSAATQPSRSAALTAYLAATARPTVAAPNTFAESADAGDAPAGRSGDSSAAAMLAGNYIPRASALASTIAPTDGRLPGSRPLQVSNPRTLPMNGDVPRSLALRADPAGNPTEAIPSAEEVARVSAVLGVGSEAAEQLITGQMSLTELQASAGVSAERAEMIGGLLPNDPRWSTFYYGPKLWIRDWEIGPQSGFNFSSGGGTYERSDRRVNQDFDMRTRGDVDRRVNSPNDRRIDRREDPRVNY